MKQVIVVGGGAAGMMAAVASAQNGNFVTLLEQNEKLGKKIYITGKGRCNLTNACEISDFFDNVFSGREFSYSAVYGFTPNDLLALLDSVGLKTKIERGNRVFPQSDKASDVTKALQTLLNQYGVNIQLNVKVSKVLINDGHVVGVELDNGKTMTCEDLILCCGGKSYPATGSDGNGYRLARDLGHSIQELSPALVPFLSDEKWVHELTGLSLTNVRVSLWEKGKKIGSQFGEMLFTHQGVSGPAVLTLSCLTGALTNAYLSLDLKPALDEKTLERRILRDFEERKNKNFQNSLDALLPRRLAETVIGLSGIDPEKKINQITSAERLLLVRMLKNLKIEISGKADFNEAIITKGGINLKEINPSTMESKLINGVYFAGEMLDLHAYTGGYNLQLAFSTGYLAGISTK